MAIKIAGTEVINDNRELVLAKLTEINTSISDTAVDIFVYDTRKDSDGGAWRKRTQGTSWYNETLNTATRGSRKEFPAVAIIVAESNQVTIYDGDDPDLPMWMVFNVGRTPVVTMLNWFTSGTASVSSVAQLNGRLCVGTDGGVTQFDFVEDAMYLSYTPSTAYTPINNRLSSRNDSNAASAGSSNENFYFIVNVIVNDVAMTVLPNAPIDAATGLPVPTIAVATDGGVSVIKDDGTVVDITNSSSTFTIVGEISFYDSGLYFTMGNSNGSLIWNYGFWTIPQSDNVITLNTKTGSTQNADAFYRWDISRTYTDVSFAGDYSATQMRANQGPNFGSTYALQLVAEDKSNASNGMGAQITSSYNTGWMNGDIKLATLSDTDATNVTGSELVTNGDFATDSDWTKGTGWTIGSGVATATNVSNFVSIVSTGFATEVGKTYVATFTITARTAGGARIVARSIGGTTLKIGDTVSAAGEVSATFTAVSTTSTVEAQAIGTTSLSIDNFTCRLAEEDRSVNGNGLQVFGTVTKSAVATGADLVGYSGFSNSNYLQQPYNSDLDFGTGDFCIMGWFKVNSGVVSQALVLRKTTLDNTRNGFGLDLDGTARLRFHTRSGSNTDLFSTGSVADGNWKNVVAYRQNGTMYMYLDGVLNTSSTGTLRDLTNSTANVTYGFDQVSGGFALTGGSLALMRISATVPSPEQIRKIYEDEKVLFQENAKATLYGSSDAVTALAYDDSNGILSVGTSAGRSDFQGLRRVNNTTNAVGAAISASNGLIVEE